MPAAAAASFPEKVTWMMMFLYQVMLLSLKVIMQADPNDSFGKEAVTQGL